MAEEDKQKKRYDGIAFEVCTHVETALSHADARVDRRQDSENDEEWPVFPRFRVHVVFCLTSKVSREHGWRISCCSEHEM